MFLYILDPPFQLIDDISGDEFRKLVDLNMISYFLLAKVTTISLAYISAYCTCIDQNKT